MATETIPTPPDKQPESQEKKLATDNSRALLWDFDDKQISRLRAMKERYLKGDYADQRIETRRLEFTRWLAVHNKISG